MGSTLMKELQNLLNDANLSTYEINAFIYLLGDSAPKTAKQISQGSNVPSGRIYEILEDLNRKGLIEIRDSRPKKYQPIDLGQGLDNLISYQDKESKRKTRYLFDKAKIIEKEFDSSALFGDEKQFWTVVYGDSIYSMYTDLIDNVDEEIILNGFLNERTLKILPLGKNFYVPLRAAEKRGVKIRELWSFEFDKRELTMEDLARNRQIFDSVKQIHKSKFDLSNQLKNYDMRYIQHTIPTFFDIFDKKRIIFKLRNPLNPHQVFAVMNVVDPNLAEELRRKFLNIWSMESITD